MAEQQNIPQKVDNNAKNIVETFPAKPRFGTDYSAGMIVSILRAEQARIFQGGSFQSDADQTRFNTLGRLAKQYETMR